MKRRRIEAVTALFGGSVALSEAVLIHLGRTYGSTRAERASRLPGDDIVSAPVVVTNHAITIDAPPEDVWPWMVQMGWGRGGWYTARWVDRLLFCTRRVICRRAGAKPSAPLSTGHGRSC